MNNYINSIRLKNFQSHKDTEIKPAPPGQLTVIIGPSDSGKTALIRGLKWAAYNSPQGADFIRVGAPNTEVIVRMNDGAEVTRHRSRGGVNRYIVAQVKDGKKFSPQTYESFGVNVPLEVQEVLQMAPINIGDMEFNLNLSEQLDGPFLGNATPSTARAKVLGMLSGVEEVDHANKTLGTDLYRKKREKEGYENQVKHLEKQIEEYGYLDELGPLTEVIDGIVAGLKIKVQKKQQLATLRIRLTGTQAAINQEEEKLINLSSLDVIEGILNNAADAAVKHKTLSAAQAELGSVTASLQAANEIIEQTAEVETAEKTLFLTATLNDQLTALKKHSEDINTITRSLNQIDAILEATEDIPDALEIIQRIADKSEKLKALTTKGKALEWLRTDVQNIEAVLDTTKDVDSLLDKAQALAKAVERRRDLAIKQVELRQYNQAIADVETVLESTKDVDSLIVKVQKLATAMGRRSDLNIKLALLKQNQEAIKAAEEELDVASRAVITWNKELAIIYKEAAVCPLCGNRLNSEKLLEEVV